MTVYEPWGKRSIAGGLVWITERGAFRAFFTLAAVFFVPTCILALAQGTAFVDKTSFITLFEDFSTVSDFLVLSPLALVLAGRYYLRISAAVSALVSAESLLLDRKSASSMVDSANRLMSSPLLSFMPVVAGFAAMMMNASVRSQYTNDYALQGDHSITGWYVVLVTSLFMAAMFELILRAACSNVLISRLVRPGVRLNPIAADKCCGFFPIGRAALVLAFVVLVEFFTVLTMLLMDAIYFGRHSSFRVVGLGAAVVVFSPLLFLWLVMPVHRAMRRAKDSMLGQIDSRSRRLQQDLMQLLDTGQDVSTDSAYSIADEYDGMRRLHALADEVPSWPVTRLTAVSYTATLLIPVIVSLAVDTAAAAASNVATRLPVLPF